MTSKQDHIDEFESMFRAAERAAFDYVEVPLQSVALVTDKTANDADATAAGLQKFMPRLDSSLRWHFLTGTDFQNVGELLHKIDERQTDLIVTYRHLQEESLIPQHSLGVYLDVMTQTTTIPVLVLPGTAARPRSLAGRTCNRVAVVTDHISGDNRLINYGVRLCATGGRVWLCHVEDNVVFRRYVDALSRVPEIDTDLAARRLEEQLLKEARDFIETCIAELRAKQPEIDYEAVVALGHPLQEYRELVDEHDVDLVVANTKDEGQLAMHGMAYSLSVELTDVALLLL